MTTAPAIIQPEVELTVCSYLSTKLALHGYATSIRIANTYADGTDYAVWVRNDGGSPLDTVRALTRIGVSCFAPSDESASQLARTVSALLKVMPDGNPVIRVVQVAAPYPVEDKKPLRYATYEIWTRGAAL